MSSLPRHTTPVDTKQEEQDRLTRDALADVDAGRVIDHLAVQAWAGSLGTDQPLPVPGMFKEKAPHRGRE